MAAQKSAQPEVKGRFLVTDLHDCPSPTSDTKADPLKIVVNSSSTTNHVNNVPNDVINSPLKLSDQPSSPSTGSQQKPQPNPPVNAQPAPPNTPIPKVIAQPAPSTVSQPNQPQVSAQPKVVATTN